MIKTTWLIKTKTKVAILNVNSHKSQNSRYAKQRIVLMQEEIQEERGKETDEKKPTEIKEEVEAETVAEPVQDKPQETYNAGKDDAHDDDMEQAETAETEQLRPEEEQERLDEETTDGAVTDAAADVNDVMQQSELTPGVELETQADHSGKIDQDSAETNAPTGIVS